MPRNSAFEEREKGMKMTMAESTFRWLQRKRYQYEVTFSLYMLTPTEKFIFNSFIFLFITMTLIGASLYLPQHLSFIMNRGWFYYNGEPPAETKSRIGVLASAVEAVMGTGRKSAAGASVTGLEEAVNTITAAVARETVVAVGEL